MMEPKGIADPSGAVDTGSASWPEKAGAHTLKGSQASIDLRTVQKDEQP
jgi:hypothetical protein